MPLLAHLRKELRNSSEHSIVSRLMTVVTALLHHVAAASPDLQNVLAQAGAVPSLLALCSRPAQEAQPELPAWVGNAVGTLHFLAAGDATDSRCLESRRQMRQLQGVPVMLRTVQRALALIQLASDPGQSWLLGEAKAVALVRAFGVAQQSAWTIAHLLSGEREEAWKEVEGADGVQTIVTLLKVDNSACRAAACSALATLVAGRGSAQSAAVREGCLPHLISLISSKVHVSQVHALTTLSSVVANSDENQVAASKGGCIPLLLALLHPTEDGSWAGTVAHHAAVTLYYLVANQPSNQRAVHAAGGVMALQALLASPSTRGVAQQALDALSLVERLIIEPAGRRSLGGRASQAQVTPV